MHSGAVCCMNGILCVLLWDRIVGEVVGYARGVCEGLIDNAFLFLHLIRIFGWALSLWSFRADGVLETEIRPECNRF